MTRRSRRRINHAINALLIILGGLTVGWLLGQVLFHAGRANVAAPDTTNTWSRALAAIPVVTIGVWAVVQTIRTRDEP